MDKIKDGHIGYNEAIALFVALISAKIFVFGPAHMIKDAGNAAYLVAIINTLLTIVLFLAMNKLLMAYPGKNLIQVGEELVGPFFNIIFSLFIIIILFTSAVVSLRSTMEFIKTIILPVTPISVLMILYIIAIIYAAYQGIESLSRGIWLFGPFILVGLIIIISAVYPFMNTNNIFPILGPGLPTIAKYSLAKVSMYAELILLGVIYPFIRKRDKFKRIGLISIYISGLLIFGSVLAILFTFPVELARDETFPIYRMAQLIYFGRFVQRVEPIFIFLWIFVTLIKLAIVLYGTSITLAQTLKLPVYRPLIFPLALLMMAVSLVPNNIEEVEHLDIDLLHMYGGFVLLVPVLYLVVHWVRSKRRKRKGERVRT